MLYHSSITSRYPCSNPANSVIIEYLSSFHRFCSNTLFAIGSLRRSSVSLRHIYHTYIRIYTYTILQTVIIIYFYLASPFLRLRHRCDPLSLNLRLNSKILDLPIDGLNPSTRWSKHPQQSISSTKAAAADWVEAPQGIQPAENQHQLNKGWSCTGRS